MKYLRFIWLMVIMVIAGACSSEKSEPVAPENTVLMDFAQAKNGFDLTGIVDTADVSIVPLELTDECLIGKVSRVFLRRDRIFVFDEQTQGVYAFDKTGKYLAKVQVQGGGPEEYLHASDAFVDDENIYIADGAGWRVQLYDLNGRYVRTVKTDGWPAHGVFAAGGRIYYVNRVTHPAEGDYLLFSTDKEGKDLQKHIPFESAWDRALTLHDPYCYGSDGHTGFFHANAEDVLYRIDKNGVFPDYELDFGGMKLPAEFLDKSPSYIVKNGYRQKYILFPDYVSVSGRYVFLGANIMNDTYHIYTVIYDRVSHETTVTDNAVLPPFGSYQTDLSQAQNDYLVLVKDAYWLTSSVSSFEKYLQEHPVILTRELTEQFRDVLSKITENDNPVLFLYKLKE